jgi:hypothetical protein
MQFTQHSDQFRRKYDPPTGALVGGFILRVLNPSYVQDDYEAVMAAVLGFTNFLVLATHGLLKLCLSRTIDGILNGTPMNLREGPHLLILS